MIDPRVFDFLKSAQEELMRWGGDGLQPAMVEVGKALAAMDLDHDNVRIFIEEDFYQMVAALLMPSDRAVKHFWEYLEKGINQMKYGNTQGPQIQRPKSQWRKMLDGEIILPGDPK